MEYTEKRIFREIKYLKEELERYKEFKDKITERINIFEENELYYAKRKESELNK